ncbi:MAG: hypothetical protein ACOCYN_04470 [Planctomycetota bacterium]
MMHWQSLIVHDTPAVMLLRPCRPLITAADIEPAYALLSGNSVPPRLWVELGRNLQPDFITGPLAELRLRWLAHPAASWIGRAVIHAPDDLAFGLARMYTTLVHEDSDRLHVARELAIGARWLDLTPERIAALIADADADTCDHASGADA